MTLSISEIRPVTTQEGKTLVRFSLTLTDDTGDALMTQEGFLLDVYRRLRAPSSVNRYGKSFSYTKLSAKFETNLLNSLEEMSEIIHILGPRQELEPKVVEKKRVKKNVQ